MAISEGKQQYLAWLRTNFPELYTKTVTPAITDHLAEASGYAGMRIVSGAPGLSGMGDASTDAFGMGTDVPNFDAGNITMDAPQITVDNSSSVWDSISSNAGSLFSTITSAVSQLAPAYVQTKAQLSLLDINTARAQQGLPPLTYYNGQQVTASGLAPANSQVRGVETALSTVTSPSFLLIAGLGIGALVLLSSKRR